MLFGMLLFVFTVAGLLIAALGNPAIYRLVTGQETASADDERASDFFG